MMVYGKLRQFGASSVLVFHVAVVLTLIYSCRGQSQVIGPLHPVVALIGEDIILPCSLKPVMNAFIMTVEWARPDLDPRFVLVWRDGLELESKKNLLYRSRTSLFTDVLMHGNISLKLSSVKLSDEGTYRCFIPELDRDSTTQLVVGAASSLVNVSEISRNSSAVELECESAGWYPEPELLWLDGEGNLLSAGATETFRGPDDLYTVSSRVTVEKKHGNKLTCRVQKKNINQSRETLIHVADDFVTDPPPPSPSSSPVAAIIGLIVGIMFTLAVVFFVWKWRQIKLKKKKDHSDEETVKIRDKTNSSGGNDDLTESLIGREAAENVNMEKNPLSERTGSDIQTEDETQQSQTNNHLTQTQEETEKQSGHERAELQPLVDEGRQSDQPLEIMSGPDKDQEDTTNSENSPVEINVNNEGNETEAVREIGRETTENLDMERSLYSERTGFDIQTEDETHQSQTNNHLTQTQEETENQSGAVRGNTNTVMNEETQQEQPIEVRNTENNLQAEGENNLQEVQSDLNKEMENLKSKLQAKEKDEREYGKRVTRMMGRKMELKKQIKDLKEQLEEVERKLQFKNEKEETQTEEDEKNLQRKKEELQKQLKRFETALEKSNKELDILTQKKMKATQEKEEIIRKLEMKNMNENQCESDDDL